MIGGLLGGAGQLFGGLAMMGGPSPAGAVAQPGSQGFVGPVRPGMTGG
jgi:hypothetical protein